MAKMANNVQDDANDEPFNAKNYFNTADN